MSAGIPAGSTAVGSAADAILAPALVIDADAMRRNIERMAAFARGHGIALRPHAKTHKSAALAKLQMAAGAVGVCVQKLSEAEALAAAGVANIYISNEIVDVAKLARLAALAGRITLALAVDSVLGIDRLAAALKAAGTSVDVFVEIDVGQGRCGVAPTAASRLAHQVVSHGTVLGAVTGGMRFAGLQAYHGKAQHLRSAAEREAAVRHAVAGVRAAQASITSAGIHCPLVTGGGTGSFMFDAASGVYGELQPGSYVFMDCDYSENEAVPQASPGRPKRPGLPSGDDAAGVQGPAIIAPMFEQALFVKAQVISRGYSHAVVDAGHKAHAIDSGLPRVWSFTGASLLDFTNGGDEHGILRPRPGASADALPQLGDTVWLVPGHCDPTVNLHDHCVLVRGGLERGLVEAVWPVDARGCLV
ncbi:MAG: DSD1 family PLP-dependent enzyme [Rhizobacter sp.]|nr:DSD1 family PLP-dependent enzyme [Rhizobacter sp.]